MTHVAQRCLHMLGPVHRRRLPRKTKLSRAEDVNMVKTLPERRAATMFVFSPSRPNDAVLAVKHSRTKWDKNILSVTAGGKCRCKTKTLSLFVDSAYVWKRKYEPPCFFFLSFHLFLGFWPNRRYFNYVSNNIRVPYELSRWMACYVFINAVNDDLGLWSSFWVSPGTAHPTDRFKVTCRVASDKMMRLKIAGWLTK